MYRARQPKERYFQHVMTGNTGCSSELGNIHKKADMIKQLQDKLQSIVPNGRRSDNNNRKNMSQIKCAEINAYIKPYVKVVKARHLNLSIEEP